MKSLLGITGIGLVGSAAVAMAAEVTFSEHIAPIVFNHCTSCHRPGEAGPFPLTDYATVKKRARMIGRVVAEGYMPPWHPEPGWGEFLGERRLTEEEKALIGQWIEAGAPEGDPKLAPVPPEFPEGWFHGEPDLVLEMDEAFPIPAEGDDIYRYFVLPIDLPEDKYVRAVEVRPSERSVVHHVLFQLDDKKSARRLDGQDGKAGFNGRGFRPSGSLGGWAVGGTPLEFVGGYARHLPKGSDLVLQTHFHPSGKAVEEKTKVGLYFAKKKPERSLIDFQIPPDFGIRAGLNIPPGASEYELRDQFTVPEDLELLGAWGHAHQICARMEVTAKLPDGSEKKLFKIGEWDFNWQGQYAYREPVALPKGTVLDALIVYDNSSENTANPFDPPRRVYWGEQSNDEMGSFIFECVATDPAMEEALRSGIRQQKRASGLRTAEARSLAIRTWLVMQLDADHDDRVSWEETPEEHRKTFQILDGNKDRFVDPGEIKKLGGFLNRKFQR